MKNTIKIITKTEKETIKLGKEIAKQLNGGDVVALFGSLGSGKTILTKGIARGLGVKENEVSSPSFVLVKEYQAKLPVYHIDLYRLDKRLAVEREGFDDYLYYDGVTVIEWAERMDELLPSEYLRIDLKIKDKDEREISLIAIGKRYRKLIKNLKSKFFK
jgi:tRNA threonylcarbamoyladenosine biosynthesis protein TsaE